METDAGAPGRDQTRQSLVGLRRLSYPEINGKLIKDFKQCDGII